MSYFKDAGYRITSPYGWRIHPVYKTRKFHAGIDLVIADKAPIKAFVGGKVVHAGHGAEGSGIGGYGNVVAIAIADGTLHIYAHLHDVKVKVGEQLKFGQVVGTQGNTGVSAGSHLHFEIRRKQSPNFGYSDNKEESTINPESYFAEVPGKQPASTQPVYYVVKGGDSLSIIASRHATNVKLLLKLNPTIKDADSISVGQKIRLK